MLTIAATVLVGFPTIAPAIADGLVTVRIGANYDLPNGLPISAFQAKAVFCRTVWGEQWGGSIEFEVLDVPTLCEVVDLYPSHPSTTASLPGGNWTVYLALREAIEPDTPGLWRVTGPFDDGLFLVAGTGSNCEFGRSPVCRPDDAIEVSRVERVSLRVDGTQYTYTGPYSGSSLLLCDFYDTGLCRDAISDDGRHVAFSAPDAAMGEPELVVSGGYRDWRSCGWYGPGLGQHSRSIFVREEGDAAPHRLPTPVRSVVYDDYPESGIQTTLACPDAPALSADGRYVAYRDRYQMPWEAEAIAACSATCQDLAFMTRIYAFDRDADGNGVYDEAGPGRTSIALVGRPATPGAVTPNAFTPEWLAMGDPGAFDTGLKMSPGGRYVVWTAKRLPVNGESHWNQPGQVHWHDRDADGDGVFDEPGQVETRLIMGYADRVGEMPQLAGDYAGASGTLRFEPGETSRTIEVVVAEATGGEDDEFLTVDLSAPAGATLATGSVRIDVVSPESVAAKGISVSDAATPEGDLKNGTLRFVVSLDAPATTPVTVQIATEDGTATGAAKPTTPGVDYKILTPKALTFLPGQVAKPVSVLVVPDLLAEGDETVRLVASNATGMGIGRSVGTGTIRDDDPVTGNPARTGDAVIVEGDAKARPVFVGVRFATPLAAPTTVTYTTRDGSATGAAKPKGVPGDYLIRARSVALRAGATSFVIPITILPDTAHEGFESFDVVVDTPDGPITATVTIHDDE